MKTTAMESPEPQESRQLRGTLEEYLSAEDIVPLPTLTDVEWDRLRRTAGAAVAWRFCTLRNLWQHRGRFVHDAFGFAWGGIYRTLLVGSIVSTSYRNEGLFRSGERIGGTSDFFRAVFGLPRSSPEFEEVVRGVNLRHHVAGVVVRHADGGYRVLDGYEADYAYVATAFIESIRRGLTACGLPPGSPGGRKLAEQVCTVLYQVAGFTGLRRVPRDLAAHERFRDAYDRRLRERPSSGRVRRMAREIARRIVPVTAAHADETVADHVRRHVDPETASRLFPEGIDPAVDSERRDWQRRLQTRSPIADIQARSRGRLAVATRPDMAALLAAYVRAAPQSNADRLIGAILLNGLESARDDGRPFERRTIELAADEPLIRQGATVREMYVVLTTTAPLIVLRTEEAEAAPRQLAEILPPTVLGEIGMWRSRPAVATVTSREPNRIEVLVIDAARFESLKEEPGFRAAAAAEVQRRLAINAALVRSQLDDVAAQAGDPRLVSISQLFRYLSGDSHGRLDAVIDLPEDATPAECVDALRSQVDEVIAAGGLSPELSRYLQQVVSTIG